MKLEHERFYYYLPLAEPVCSVVTVPSILVENCPVLFTTTSTSPATSPTSYDGRLKETTASSAGQMKIGYIQFSENPLVTDTDQLACPLDVL